MRGCGDTMESRSPRSTQRDAEKDEEGLLCPAIQSGEVGVITIHRRLAPNRSVGPVLTQRKVPADAFSLSPTIGSPLQGDST